MVKKSYLLLIFLVAMTLLVGCGGGGTNPPAKPSQIVITPSSASVVYGGGTKHFTAVCTDTGGHIMNGVTFSWSVEPANMGTIDENGVFTAGNTKGQCQVICSYGAINQQAAVDVVGLLGDFGAQIVADTQTVWGNLEGPLQGLVDVVENVPTELEPKIPYLNLPLSISVYYLDINFLAKLFRLTPGEYSREYVLSSSGEGPFFTSSATPWTVTDASWTVVYTRSVAAGVDNVTMEAHDSERPDIDYQGNATYTTAYLADMNADPVSMEVDLDFDDATIDPSTCNGSFAYDTAAHTGTFHGDIDFEFPDNTYLKYNGDWNFAFTPGTEDSMVGSLETDKLKIDGGMHFNYVQNTTFLLESPVFNNLVPSSMVLNGSIVNKAGTDSDTTDDTTLAGSMNLTISNADTLDFGSELSATNFIVASLTYNGSIQTAANKIDGTLKLESTAYNRYKITLLYDLLNGGVARSFTASIANKTNEMNSFTFTLSSSWGDAEVSMDDISFNSEYQLINVNGTVTVSGEQVGTISLVDGLIRVDYINGQYETF